MSLRPKRIAIIGAGIGGLTLAACLLRHGHSVLILEKSPQLRTHGVGLQLSPNGLYILNQLRLSAGFHEKLHHPENIRLVLPGLTKHLTTLKLPNKDQVHMPPYAVIHRADLLQAMYQKVASDSRATFHFGVHHFDLTRHRRGHTLNFETHNFSNQRDHPDLIVGADGVHSTTRLNYTNDVKTPYSGYIAWRTLIPLDNVPEHVSHQDITAVMCNKMHVVLYPLRAHHQMNCVIIKNCPKRDLSKKSPQELWSGLEKKISKYQALKFLTHPDLEWQHWPLYAARRPVFTARHKDEKTPNVILLGDAAHPMLPFQAQGAAMAIEDAACLANALLSNEISDAFALFAQQRHKRVHKVMRQAKGNGEIFHFSGPMGLARNLYLRLLPPHIHQKRVCWIYDHIIDLATIQPPASNLIH